MSEAEAAYADALARIKAATAGDSVDALAVHAARADLAAAKKALNSSGKVKKKRANTYKKVSPAGSGEAAPAATAAAVCQLPRQPARLPGFGSQEYWDAQPDNPAWQHYPAHITIPTESTYPAHITIPTESHYPAHITIPTESTSGFITNEADNGHGSTVASASAPSSTSASQIGVCKDAGAEQWTKSFDVDDSAAALQFWEDYGFVIFRDVLTLEECDSTVSEIWSTLEEDYPGLSRTDSSTHALLPSKRYGLAEKQAMFTPQLVRNRQSPKLYKALDVVTPEWPQPTAEQLSQQHLSTEGAASVHSTTPATPATNPITDAAA
eukprot:gene17454-14253_t